jgi:hypothetical protein
LHVADELERLKLALAQRYQLDPHGAPLTGAWSFSQQQFS